MKKILLGASVFFATLLSAQYYPNNNDWGNNYPEYGNYDNENYYFPDDYYYEYPEDYYEDDYYVRNYNDYRRSIAMVNWNIFFREFGLSRTQINLVIDLNRQFPSYSVWNSYYRMNPKRWWYDRFYALEQILGPRIFIVFQDRYYNGYNPVIYYNDYWYNYYRPRYYVMPHYRHININVYKINRYDYHRNIGNKYGWNQPRNPHNPGGFREDNYRNNPNKNQNGGFRNQNENGFRSQNSDRGFRNNTPRTTENNSYQNQRGNEGVRNGNSTRTIENDNRNGGNRNYTIPGSGNRNDTPRDNGFRNGNENRNRNFEGGQRNPTPRMESQPRNNERNSGGERGG